MNTCTILSRLVEYVERWRERLVRNIIEPLAVNRDHLARFCRTNVSLDKVVYRSLVYIAVARTSERARKTHALI